MIRKYVIPGFGLLVAFYILTLSPELVTQVFQFFVDAAYQVARAITKIDLPGLSNGTK